MFSHEKTQKMHLSVGDGPSEVGHEIQWSDFEIKCRFAMSYISNGLYKAIIVYTLPLWLSRGGLTDFVLNAFATVYIVELDDLASRDEWKWISEQKFFDLSKQHSRHSKRSTTIWSSEASTEASQMA